MKLLRTVAILFIFLLFFGVIAYTGIIWARLWTTSVEVPNEVPNWSSRSIQKVSRTVMRVPNNKLNDMISKKRRSAIAPYIKAKLLKKSSDINMTTPTQVIVRSQGAPRFPNIHNAVLELDSTKYSCNDSESAECERRSSTFGELLQKELNRVVMYESKVFRSGLDKQNTYNVSFGGVYGSLRSREDLVCALRGVRVRTVTGREEPFVSRGFPVPAAPLRLGRVYDSCAVVSSAGALLGSRLGRFIDSHDMVLRFNNAPTENYTDDVGSKTTFRILNSQVVAKPEYNFLLDPLYSNISIIIWDPANYSSTLESWYRSPDYPLFDIYKRYVELNPEAEVHLLKPEVLWDLWNVMQSSTTKRIRRNPPSSGLIGIWFAMQRCARVDVFEYVPSARVTARCHYYSPRADRACTLGTWHPLAQEKAVVNKMRDNSDFEAFQRGFITIQGTQSFNCPE